MIYQDHAINSFFECRDVSISISYICHKSIVKGFVYVNRDNFLKHVRYRLYYLLDMDTPITFFMKKVTMIDNRVYKEKSIFARYDDNQ